MTSSDFCEGYIDRIEKQRKQIQRLQKQVARLKTERDTLKREPVLVRHVRAVTYGDGHAYLAPLCGKDIEPGKPYRVEVYEHE